MAALLGLPPLFGVLNGSVTLTGGPATGSVTKQTTASFTVGANEGSLTCMHNGVSSGCAPGRAPKGSTSGGRHRSGGSPRRPRG